MRRRELLATTATTSIADNMFVIDDITFVYYKNPFGEEYSIENENLPHIYNTLKEYCIQNGVYDIGHYIIEMPQVEIYLFDYKIPINSIEYFGLNAELDIFSDTNILPYGYVWLLGGTTLHCNLGEFDGGWTFDHIPTTSVEAILFVEFAKQMGLDAFEIDNYNVYWREEGKVLTIGHGLEEFYVYGAYNDEKTGIIEYHDYTDGGGGGV